MTIHNIIWKSFVAETTDKKKKEHWECSNALIEIRNGVMHVTEIIRGGRQEESKTFVFGSIKIDSLMPWSMDATGIAITRTFSDKGNVSSERIRHVKIKAEF